MPAEPCREQRTKADDRHQLGTGNARRGAGALRGPRDAAPRVERGCRGDPPEGGGGGGATRPSRSSMLGRLVHMPELDGKGGAGSERDVLLIYSKDALEALLTIVEAGGADMHVDPRLLDEFRL